MTTKPDRTPEATCTKPGRAGRMPGWAALLPLTMLAGCQTALLSSQGSVGMAQRTILVDSVFIMLAIVVPTILAIGAFSWWFRESNTRATYLPHFAYSGRIELVTWSIPLLIVILLGGVTWIGAHELDPARPLSSKTPALEVQVVSLDWKWLFIYPDQHIASVNELVVPAGRPIHFSLTSASVMNTFFVPQLGSMIYTMNHMTTQLNLQANRPGDFHGLSGHYSGDGFSDMHFEVHAVSADQFASWVTTTRAAGPALDAPAYTQLARQSSDVAPTTFRDATPALFQKIVTQEIPPGPGPAADTPNRDISPKREK